MFKVEYHYLTHFGTETVKKMWFFILSNKQHLISVIKKEVKTFTISTLFI